MKYKTVFSVIATIIVENDLVIETCPINNTTRNIFKSVTGNLKNVEFCRGLSCYRIRIVGCLTDRTDSAEYR